MRLSLLFILSAALVISTSLFIYIQIPKANCQMFSIQAQRFIHGHFDMPFHPDVVTFNGKYYWPQGPFPSLILIPFQLIFGTQFNQSIMQPLLVLVLSIALFKLARNKGFSHRDAGFLTYAFLFASVIIGIITEPCYSFFAHIITVTLLSLFLLEYEGRRRWIFLGMLGGAILATRPTAGIVTLLLAFLLFFSKLSYKEKLSRLTAFCIPIIFSIILLLWFNFIRFHNIFNNGYSSNNVGDYLESLRSLGVFSPSHIISNFYYYFLISVQPIIKYSTHLTFPYFTYNPVGLSFLVISPFFLLSLKTIKSCSNQIRIYWISIVLTLLILLSYYNPGWVQFGPRFTSDFMPILYLLTLYSFKTKRLVSKEVILVILSSLINSYLLLTGFNLFKR